MALLRDIVFKRAPALQTLLKEEREKLNLRGVQKVTIRFDPFGKEPSEIRKFANLLYAKSSVKTNAKCIIKTEVLTDRSEQSVTFDLKDGKQFIFKCANLKCLEIYKLMNLHITPLAPVEVEVSTDIPKGVKKGKNNGKKRRL